MLIKHDKMFKRYILTTKEISIVLRFRLFVYCSQLSGFGPPHHYCLYSLQIEYVVFKKAPSFKSRIMLHAQRFVCSVHVAC